MTQPTIPPNAYTHSPKQHSNLIIGCLQLLFWLVFQPTAWENHIQGLAPYLSKNSSLMQIVRQQRWTQKPIQRFLFQAFILLPVVASLTTGMIALSIGTPLETVAYGVAFGTTLGFLFSAIVGEVFGATVGVAYGVAMSVAYSVASGIDVGMTVGITGSAAVGMTAGIAVGVTENIVLGIVLGVIVGMTFSTALGITVGVTLGIAFSVGLCVNWWRPILMSSLLRPWHLLLYNLDKIRAGQQPSLLHRHLACWDEWQVLKIQGLDKHLVLLLEHSPREGRTAINFLITGPQRWAAQAAQIELDARQLENCTTTDSIGTLHTSWTLGGLSETDDTWCRSFNRISKDIDAAINQNSTYNQRLALTSVSGQLDSLIRELTRSSDQYAARFRPISQRWCNIVALKLHDLTQTAEQTQEIDSPYIIGVPLTDRQEIFVGRTDISTRIEQLLLDRRRPPLLVYGQRRTGKTSLLNNLGKLLPNSIVPLFVDLQGPASRASNHTGFLYNLAKGMTDSANRQRNLTFPPLSREALTEDPFTTFDEWLDTVETTLGERTALLALDEFEVLDQALTTGKFNEAYVLGMLRNLIQQRPRFKVLFAGSHTLQEFQRWSSYLINAQVLHLSYLKESEARQLIEQPSPDFALRYDPDASQRILDVTRCHPYLVQSLCAEIVVLKNEQDPSIRRIATLADIEAAIPEVLSNGIMFFSDIECNQVDAPARAVLKYIANQGEGASISESSLVQQLENATEGINNEQMQDALSLLIRRELIETTESGHYQIQIELFRRWFAQSN